MPNTYKYCSADRVENASESIVLIEFDWKLLLISMKMVKDEIRHQTNSNVNVVKALIAADGTYVSKLISNPLQRWVNVSQFKENQYSQ